MIIGAVVITLITFLTGDPLVAPCLAALVLGWVLLRVDEGPQVLFMAFGFQWTQVTCGFLYYAFTGRAVDGIVKSNYRPAVLMGLGCIVALAAGLRLGIRIASRSWRPQPIGGQVLTWRMIVIAYVAATVLAPALQQLAWSIPELTQPLIALGFVRLALLFLMLHRLSVPSLQPTRIAALLAAEVLLGFTGYFAGFREPLIMGMVAMSEGFELRRASHWLTIGALLLVLGLSSTLWMSIRTEYRASIGYDEALAESRTARLDRISALTSTWLKSGSGETGGDLDALIDRAWTVYYPALAIERVPSLLPHTDGAILGAAIRHILMPRVLFPDKARLASDSEMVRKYSGVLVAGEERDTSIAFGYMAESYVDFGVPLMFVPSFLYGIAMGAAFQFVFSVIRWRELAISLVTVMFWLILYLFERSWVKTLGLAGTLFIYLGALALVIDKLLMQRFVKPPEIDLAVLSTRDQPSR